MISSIWPTLALAVNVLLIVTFLIYLASLRKPRKHWGNIIGLLLVVIFFSYILINFVWSFLQWQIWFTEKASELCKGLRGGQTFTEIGPINCDCYNGWALC